MTGVDFQSAQLSDTTVRYRQAGHGEPLVLLHPSSGVRVTRAVRALEASFEVFQPTFPGFDDTPLPPNEIGVVDLARWMAEFIDTVVGAPAMVAGHSFGGWVACWLAVEHPELVRHLVLQCPLGFGPLLAPAPNATPAELLARTYTHPEKCVKETKSEALLSRNRALAARVGRAVTEDAELMQRMTAVELPVLVVYGGNDGLVRRSGMEWIEGSVQSARLETVDDAAHHVESDQPERYVELVAGFACAHVSGTHA